MNSVFSIYENGPAPFQTQFESQVEGSALVFLCGSCWRAGSPGLAGLSLTIDGSPVAQTQLYLNETKSHQALPSVLVEIEISGGPHTLGISMTNGDMTTDHNDYFSAGVFFF